MERLKEMKDIYNWKEVTRGLYRFGIGVNSCYEIHIIICKEGEDVLSMFASLFLVGDFYDKNKIHFFVRQCLLENQPVCACIEKAIQNYKENMRVIGVE